MSELTQSAANIIVPFLAAGGGAVAAGTAEEAGADVYRAMSRIMSKIGGGFRSRQVDVVEATLAEALADDRLTVADLQELVTALASSGSSTRIGRINAKNVFVGETKIKKFKA